MSFLKIIFFSNFSNNIIFQGVHPSRRVYKLVLTGGPCGGKTTGQAKLATFFENLGWKVFRVPETATVLMSGGIAFGDLNEEQIFDFQVIIYQKSLGNNCFSSILITKSQIGKLFLKMQLFSADATIFSKKKLIYFLPMKT